MSGEKNYNIRLVVCFSIVGELKDIVSFNVWLYYEYICIAQLCITLLTICFAGNSRRSSMFGVNASSIMVNSLYVVVLQFEFKYGVIINCPLPKVEGIGCLLKFPFAYISKYI